MSIVGRMCTTIALLYVACCVVSCPALAILVLHDDEPVAPAGGQKITSSEKQKQLTVPFSYHLRMYVQTPFGYFDKN